VLGKIERKGEFAAANSNHGFRFGMMLQIFMSFCFSFFHWRRQQQQQLFTHLFRVCHSFHKMLLLLLTLSMTAQVQAQGEK